MAKKSTTKVYGFKATPMREQFKRERELLMRQMRRYEKKGFIFDSSVQVPAKERAGKRITKSYIEKLQALRKSIPELAYRVTDESGTRETARQYMHQRRGEYAQRQKLTKRLMLESDERKKSEWHTEPESLPSLEHEPESEIELEIEPEPEPYSPSEQEYENPELPDIAHVIVNNFLSMFEEYADNPDAVGAKMMVDAIEQMVAEYGYRATAKALDVNLSSYPINEVAYSAILANAVITATLRDLTGEGLEEFESDGGYWPGDDLYE